MFNKHFGAKDALLEAVVFEGLRHVAAYIGDLLTEPDPWTGVECLVRYIADQQLKNRAFKDLMGTQPALHAAATATKQELRPLIQQVLDRAQAAGQVRADVVAGDIPLLLAGLSENEIAAEVRRRYLDIILNGLRADGG